MKTSFTFLAFLLFFIYTPQVDAQTAVNSDITENTTWTAIDSPYEVQNTITVQDGVTLTIEPGVTVQMSSGASLYVEGGLVADGESGNEILFTSSSGTPAAGDWGSIEFRNNSDAGSVFDYVTVEYGAGTDRTGMVFYTTGAFGVDISNSIFRSSAVHGINLRASSPIIDNSEFYDNDGYGVYTDLSLSYTIQNSLIRENTVGGIRVPINSNAVITESVIELNPVGILIDNGGSPSITNNQIVDNDVGIRIIEVGATKPEITDNTISGNSDFGAENQSSTELDARFNYWGSALGPTVESNPSGDGDRVTAGNVDYTPWRYGATDLPVTEVDSNIAENTTWQEGNVYLITSDITVVDGVELTIEPGTVVKFSSGRSLTVDGQISAVGSESNLIFFTSERDDAAGGDSNGDGDETTPSSNNWSQININNSGSTFSYAVIRYGGSTNTSSGVLNLEAEIALSDVIVSNNYRNGIVTRVDQSGWSNVQSIDNSGYGIYLYETGLQMTGGETSLNGEEGLYARSSSSEKIIELDGLSSVENSSHGIYIDGISSRQGTRISSIQNSDISNNGGTGLLLEYSDTGAQTFSSNTIENNSGHGINLSHGMTTDNIVFQGNQVVGNGESGILSTQARFIDNHFEGNRFGVGAWKRLGHIYTDESGDDGNTFTDNTYPGAIALYADNLDGVLSASVPEVYTSPTYILASTGQANNSSHTLTIEPGVTIKTSDELVNDFTELRFEGQLIANGDEQNPIVFTSLNDHSYGGDISRVDDDSNPSRGDWGGIELHEPGTADSELSHVYFRYARNGLTVGDVFSNPAGVVYSNVFEDVWVDNSSDNGLQVREGAITFERLRATDNASSGVHLEDGNSGNEFVARAIIRNSEVTGNGGSDTSYAGLYARSLGDGAAFTEVSNTTISGNSIGIQMEESSLPSTIQFNTITDNASNGIYTRLVSVESDTSLTISGNTFSGHSSGVGALVTRAIVTDNTFEDNAFSIGLMGELSREGSANELGTVFEGNTFGEHLYDDAIALYSTSNISLEGNLGYTWPESFSNGVYIPIAGTTYVNSSNSVDVAPGTVFKMGHNSTNDSFLIQGEFNVVGDVDDKIVFTSLKDDSFAGDTNKDDNATLPDRRDWNSLEFRDAASNASLLKHAIVRYGRYNFYMDNTEAVIDSSFSSNADRGVYTTDGAKPTIRNSEIHSNNVGIYVNSDSDDPNIHLNNIYDNDDAGLHVRRNVTAIDNYWGDSTGPFVDQGSDLNLDGQGDRIYIDNSNEVTYRPFLTDRTGVLLGDVSEDGTISAFDGSQILQHVVELINLSTTQLSAADVSGDGSVSAMDASYVLQYVVGLISGFPGAGKIPDLDADQIYEIETILTDSHFDLIIKSKGGMDVVASEIDLSYPENIVDGFEILNTPETAEWNSVNQSDRGSLKLATAGLEPIKNQADLIHIRFNKIDDEDLQIKDIQISNLKINEVDVTESAGEAFDDQKQSLLPDEFTLEQNYPNPFNPSTSISYQLPVDGQVSVKVFNSIGQEVAVLVNNQAQTVGTYQVEWNASNLSSGVYFYRIEVAAQDGRQLTDMRRMTLIK